MRRSEVVRGFSSEDLAPVSRGCAVRSDVPGGVKSGGFLLDGRRGAGTGSELPAVRAAYF